MFAQQRPILGMIGQGMSKTIPLIAAHSTAISGTLGTLGLLGFGGGMHHLHKKRLKKRVKEIEALSEAKSGGIIAQLNHAIEKAESTRIVADKLWQERMQGKLAELENMRIRINADVATHEQTTSALKVDGVEKDNEIQTNLQRIDELSLKAKDTDAIAQSLLAFDGRSNMSRRSSKDIVKDMQDELTTLRSGRAALMESFANEKVAITALKEQNRDLSAIEQKITEELARSNKDNKEKVKEMDLRMQDMQAERETKIIEAEQTSKEVLDLKQTLQHNKEDALKFGQDLVDYAKKTAALKVSKHRLRESLLLSEDKNGQLQHEFEENAGKIQLAKQEHTLAQSRLQGYLKKMTRQENVIKVSEEELGTNNTRVSMLKEENQSLHDEKSSLETSLEDEKEAHELHTKQLQDSYELTQAELQNEKLEAKQTLEKLEETANALKANESEVKKLTKKLERYNKTENQENSIAARQNEVAQVELGRLIAKIDIQKESIANYEHKMGESDATISTLQREATAVSVN